MARKKPAKKAKKKSAGKAAARKSARKTMQEEGGPEGAKKAAKKAAKKKAAKPAKPSRRQEGRCPPPPRLRRAAEEGSSRQRKKPNLDRPRKTVADIHGIPSSLDCQPRRVGRQVGPRRNEGPAVEEHRRGPGAHRR